MGREHEVRKVQRKPAKRSLKEKRLMKRQRKELDMHGAVQIHVE